MIFHKSLCPYGHNYRKLRNNGGKESIELFVVGFLASPGITSLKPKLLPILRAGRRQIGRNSRFETNTKSKLC